MKKAIIVHGKPSKEGYYDPARESQSNEHWLPWLQHELIIRDILAQTPEMPAPYQPVYDDWKAQFEQLKPDASTIYVGHSAAGGFIVRWLSENTSHRLGKVVLVAPSLGLDWDHKGMYDFEINSDISSQTAGISIMVAKDDRPGILDAVKKITTEVKNVKVLELPKGGHFTMKDMGKREFPELLDEITKA